MMIIKMKLRIHDLLGLKAQGGAVMSELIEIIYRRDKLLDFMERYNLRGLREATEEQLKEYIEEVILC